LGFDATVIFVPLGIRSVRRQVRTKAGMKRSKMTEKRVSKEPGMERSEIPGLVIENENG